MMREMTNIMRREGQRIASLKALPRFGIVTSYDPARYAAKVKIQPEGYETGFLPITTPWVGNGWGLFAPPSIGEAVEVHFQEGGKEAAYIALRLYGNLALPLAVPSGEFWLVHQSGSFLKFKNDGSVEVHTAGDLNATIGGQANLTVTGKVVASAAEFDLTGNLKVTGDITASGEIYDENATKGNIGHIRTVYDSHTHNDPQGGTVGVPNQQL